MDNDLIEKTISYVKDLFRDNAGGHDAAHTLRVYRNAMMIAAEEPECDREVAALAALLHDADDHKLFRTEDNGHARTFMKENGVAEDVIERVCEAVRSVSFSKNKGRVPESIEGRVVQDADRLDAIGAIGIARAFAFGGEHGMPMEQSVQHFHDKLLLLRDMMNTEAGRRIADRRHRYLEDYLRELEEETQSIM